MGALTRTFTDDFNRANEDIDASPNWRTEEPGGTTGHIISSNVAWARSGGSYASHSTQGSDIFAGQSLLDDHTVQCKVAANGAQWGLMVRGDTSFDGFWKTNGYGVEIYSSKVELYRYIDWGNLLAIAGAPSRVELGEWVNTISVGDIIKITCEGTALKVFVNTTERISVTDATHASGQPGYFSTSGGGGIAQLDDYEMTDEGYVAPVPGAGPGLTNGIFGAWNNNIGHP